jgi:hypothetical protein
VLADAVSSTATFTVTDTGHAVQVSLPPMPSGSAGNVRLPTGGNDATPNGAAIVGQLTVDGVTGGYDVQMLAAHGAKASCEDEAHCTSSDFSDGSTLAVGRERLADGGVTYVADFVRADGAEVLMHVSDRADPKGGGALAAAPPLTPAQLRAVVTSKLW